MAQTTLLDGMVVLDATQVMAGPYCTMVLCDMGARVIKVEPPRGDSSRAMSGSVGAESPAFNAVNRGKYGIVLDLQQAAARDAFRRLARTADVLVENYRPGVMARLGLDYATLAKENPRLVYASISGYGQTGPSASKGGFDLVAQGASGIMSVTGEPGRPPVKAGLPLTDLGAGLFALAAILAAVHWRSSSGRGQYIDTSLFEAGLALSVWEATEYFSGQMPGPLGSAHRMSAHPGVSLRRRVRHRRRGQRSLVRQAGVAPRPSRMAGRSTVRDGCRALRNREALASAIEEVMSTATRADWLARFEAAGIPSGPINDYAQVFADPQVAARDMVVEVDHPVLGRLRGLGSPVKMSETPFDPRRRAPRLGEHTDEVLRSAGIGDEELREMRAAGAIG